MPLEWVINISTPIPSGGRKLTANEVRQFKQCARFLPKTMGSTWTLTWLWPKEDELEKPLVPFLNYFNQRTGSGYGYTFTAILNGTKHERQPAPAQQPMAESEPLQHLSPIPLSILSSFDSGDVEEWTW